MKNQSWITRRGDLTDGAMQSLAEGASPESALEKWLRSNGVPAAAALDSAVQLLQVAEGPLGLFEKPLPFLIRNSSVSPRTLSRTKAALELAVSLLFQHDSRIALQASSDVFRLLGHLGEHCRECFWVLGLDGRNRLQVLEKVAEGASNLCMLEPREVFHPLLKAGLGRAVFAHNHPSGDPEPSHEDRAVTNRLLEGARILGIEVLDHVIIGNGSFRSVLDNSAGRV